MYRSLIAYYFYILIIAIAPSGFDSCHLKSINTFQYIQDTNSFELEFLLNKNEENRASVLVKEESSTSNRIEDTKFELSKTPVKLSLVPRFYIYTYQESNIIIGKTLLLINKSPPAFP